MNDSIQLLRHNCETDIQPLSTQQNTVESHVVGILDTNKSHMNNQATRLTLFLKKYQTEIEQFLGGRLLKYQELTGGLTNSVILIEGEGENKIILKIGDDLSRESEFFSIVNTDGIEIFPKLLAKIGNDALIFEYRNGMNGKLLGDSLSSASWELIGNEFGRNLHILHSLKERENNETKDTSIKSMIEYLQYDTKIIDQNRYNYELQKLEQLLKESKDEFVLLHGDFSPHNCLFVKDSQEVYHISAILDPSTRVGFGSRFFDITYLMNTRWNKNKESLKRGFLDQYDIETHDPLFLQFDIVMKMYLKEIYFAMGDTINSDSIILR